MTKYANRNPSADEVASVAGALSDLTRLRVLGALRAGELCVCQLTELAGLAPSTVSRHMSVLQGADLVESRKEGRWVYYRLPEQPEPTVEGALKWALQLFGQTAQAQSDRNRLNDILECSPEELCRQQRES